MSLSRLRLALLSIATISCILIFYSLQLDGYNFFFRGLTPSDPAIEVPSWLIWTSSAANLRQRREIIRSTWQTLFRSVPFDARFVIGTPGEEWLPIIKQENDTYGDIIMLQSDSDDKEFATTLKPFEMCKRLKNQALVTGKKWTFVSKIDDDSFLNAALFRSDFLLPHQHANRTIISRVIQYSRPHQFPGGQLYTLTWDLVELIGKLYESMPRDVFEEAMFDVKKKKKLAKRHEDFMIADIMVQAGEEFEYVKLSDERAFDVITMGNVTEKAVNVHALKADEQYLWVAAMFDENGYRGTERDGVDLQEKLLQSSAKLE